MKPEWQEYLQSLEMTDVLQSRVEEILTAYSLVDSGEISEIFVSEYVNNDGHREYENLWLITETHVKEAKQFITKDDFDSMSIQGILYRWRIEKKDYDLNQATPSSRMTLIFEFGTSPEGIRGEMKSSGSNCTHLRDILIRFISPNV